MMARKQLRVDESRGSREEDGGVVVGGAARQDFNVLVGRCRPPVHARKITLTLCQEGHCQGTSEIDPSLPVATASKLASKWCSSTGKGKGEVKE